MKNTYRICISILIILALIISVSIYTLKTLDKTSKNLESQVIQIEDNAKLGEWDKAQEVLEVMQKDWGRTVKVWTMLLDHFEIDNIETTITRMSKYIEARDVTLAMTEAATLRQYIRHIPEKESFSLKNIL